jgi:quercetin dioxygenase-like cupin family protein
MRIRSLAAHHHAVYRLAPDLLLVFKPRAHREVEHVHRHRQRLRVLRGELVVRRGRRRNRLTSASRALVLPAGAAHETVAVRDTWLLAESL